MAGTTHVVPATQEDAVVNVIASFTVMYFQRPVTVDVYEDGGEIYFRFNHKKYWLTGSVFQGRKFIGIQSHGVTSRRYCVDGMLPVNIVGVPVYLYLRGLPNVSGVMRTL